MPLERQVRGQRHQNCQVEESNCYASANTCGMFTSVKDIAQWDNIDNIKNVKAKPELLFFCPAGGG